METTKYARKPFEVDAVQVTADNLAQVAEWCKGAVETAKETEKRPAEQYVKVNVHRPLNDRQTRAFINDWVLFAGTGFKVYTPKAFANCFEELEGVGVARFGETPHQNPEAGVTPLGDEFVQVGHMDDSGIKVTG